MQRKIIHFFCSYITILLLLFIASSLSAQSQDTPVGQIGNIDLAGVALLSVPKDFVFMEGNAIQSPYHTDCDSIKYLGCLVSLPTTLDSVNSPFMIELSYIETGYIPDSVISKTSEDLFWKDINNINFTKNKYIKEKGCDTVSIESWAMKPFFVEEKHLLQWAVTCRFEDKKYVCYSLHKMGRHRILEMTIRMPSEELLKVTSHLPLLASSYKIS